MARSFVFDGRSLGAMLVSGSLAGLLLFCAGVVVGVHWSGIKLAAAAPQAPLVPPGTSKPTLTAPPLPGTAPQPQILARRILPNPPPVPQSPPPAVLDVRQAATELQSPAPEAPALEAPALEAPALEAPAEVADQEPPAEPRPEFALPPLPPPPPAFSLQVGAFLQPDNLDRFVADLSERGYTPRVLEITNSSGRILSIVRVGGFANRTDATQAALTFQQREGMDALVRPEAQT